MSEEKVTNEMVERGIDAWIRFEGDDPTAQTPKGRGQLGAVVRVILQAALNPGDTHG